MFGISIKLSRGRLVAMLAAVSVAVCLIICLSAGDRGITLGSEEERMGYICSLGYDPSAQGGEVTEITIPTEFSDVYEEYNRLQQCAGFELEDYKGCHVVRYTYFLNDYPAEEAVVINLLVQEGKLIGGDVSSRRLDGFMLPLTAKE